MPFLDWVNKNQAQEASREVPYHLLKQELVYGDSAENLLIQGDNLLALKALIPFYAGRVKCIFIDPPYNTQSAFAHYDDKLEHSQWLSMMYPRLVLLRDLLAEDGSIWVTIDDMEAHYLKALIDEVFGRKNFVANVVWQKKYTIANDAKWLSDNHDHVLIYAKESHVWQPNKLPRTEEMNARYRNPDDHPKGVWKATPLHAKSGSESSKSFSYKFKNGVVWSPPAGTFPRFSEETLHRMDEGDEIWFGRDGEATPSRKTFLAELSEDGTPSPTVWLHTEAGNNHEAREEVKSFNTENPFDTPKPEKLLHRIIHLASNPGDIVLDSFLGSATTAAVAHKMGRRYIGIEMGDHARTHCILRLQKVIEGEQGGISKSVNWKGGWGFRFCTLGEAAFDEHGRINQAVRFATLAAYVWHFETGEPGQQAFDQPLLGIHNGTAYYLLYNGILGDRKPSSGNVLTHAVLQAIHDIFPHTGRKVIYGETTRLGAARLAAENITFKQIPYDVKMR
ncbi:MAG: site-specific DNA-methyltransferase [Nitrosomonadales bacterium]|nr:site-specific DNA-methyltransferase [Nitrosomonadales bacterium]